MASGSLAKVYRHRSQVQIAARYSIIWTHSLCRLCLRRIYAGPSQPRRSCDIRFGRSQGLGVPELCKIQDMTVNIRVLVLSAVWVLSGFWTHSLCRLCLRRIYAGPSQPRRSCDIRFGRSQGLGVPELCKIQDMTVNIRVLVLPRVCVLPVAWVLSGWPIWPMPCMIWQLLRVRQF